MKQNLLKSDDQSVFQASDKEILEESKDISLKNNDSLVLEINQRAEMDENHPRVKLNRLVIEKYKCKND